MTATDLPLIASTTEDAGLAFARNAATLPYGQLSEGAVRAAKLGILDTVGVALAATGLAPNLDIFEELVREVGGRPESTVLGFGGRTSAVSAAFVNGASAHALDYDDMHDELSCHPSAPIVASTLALAERIGGVSGRELIVAVAVGQDMFVRLTGSTDPWTHGFIGPLTHGGLAAAASCARLLGLDEEGVHNAIGIASMRASGPAQLIVSEGSNLRGFYAGFAARDGVLSALLASKGLGGIHDVFEGKFGLFGALFNGEHDRERMLAGLGTRFPMDGVSYKPWPSCRLSHTVIDGVLRILNEEGVPSADIRTIRLRVSMTGSRLCEPDLGRRRPATPVNGKFSIPYIAGAAAARRTITMREFDHESLVDPDVLAMVDRVEWVYDPSLDLNDPAVMPPAVVEIETTSGKTYIRRVEQPHGHPLNPISMDGLRAKFVDCAGMAAKPAPQENVLEAMRLIEKLEDVPDVDAILRLLAM
jgi:2-methylcitrate dehydratase PrpD